MPLNRRMFFCQLLLDICTQRKINMYINKSHTIMCYMISLISIQPEKHSLGVKVEELSSSSSTQKLEDDNSSTLTQSQCLSWGTLYASTVSVTVPDYLYNGYVSTQILTISWGTLYVSTLSVTVPDCLLPILQTQISWLSSSSACSRQDGWAASGECCWDSCQPSCSSSCVQNGKKQNKWFRRKFGGGAATSSNNHRNT